MIAVGRLEHQQVTVRVTIGLTVGIAILAIVLFIYKANLEPIRVWRPEDGKPKT